MENVIENWTPEKPTVPDHWEVLDFDDVFQVLSTNKKKLQQKDYGRCISVVCAH